MSGMTKSIPSMSSSGNFSPQSTIIKSSPQRKTVRFFPISPIPPSGQTVSSGFLFSRLRTEAFLFSDSAINKHNPFHNISYHVARYWAIRTADILDRSSASMRSCPTPQ